MNATIGAGIGFAVLIFAISLAPMVLEGATTQGAIPPTPAFSNIATNDTNSTTNPAWANATSYDGDLWIITDGSILIEVIKYTGAEE